MVFLPIHLETDFFLSDLSLTHRFFNLKKIMIFFLSLSLLIDFVSTATFFKLSFKKEGGEKIGQRNVVQMN